MARVTGNATKLVDRLGHKIDRNAPGQDAVHHQPVAEGARRNTQHELAQHGCLRVQEGERSVIADRAEIAEMVGDALKLGHRGAYGVGALRDFDTKCALDGAGESQPVGDRRVTRKPRDHRRGLGGRPADHQHLDAFVHIAEPSLEPHHGFARGGKAEMSRLDDAGVHRADWNLMQGFALDRQEVVRGFGAAMAPRPLAMVEPWPIVGQALWLEAVEIARRAFEADRGRATSEREGKR